MLSEKEQLIKEIRALKDQIKPKEERLEEIYQAEEKEVETKKKRVLAGKDAFILDELIFAATNRCACGAGLAYPKNIGRFGSWTCSDILLGRAIQKGKPGCKEHSQDYPFTFYEIKSENQPSAYSRTTRPRE